MSIRKPFFMAEHILSLRFSLRPFTMPARRNGAPMKGNSSTSSAKGASLSSNRVGRGEQTAAGVDPLWPGFSLYGQLWWSTQASVGKLCSRALKVRCRGSWSGCCSPSVSQNIPDRSKRCKQNWLNRNVLFYLCSLFSSEMREQCPRLLCRAPV